jgi:ketosteroid isomerase-like protein
MRHDQESRGQAHCEQAVVTRKIPLLALTLITLVFAAAHTAQIRKPAELPASQTGAQTSNAAADVDAIAQVIARYARSVEAADTTLASQIWWDSPEVSFIHPLGHERGFEQIKANVYTRLMGETFSERKLTPRDVAIHVYGDSAWAEFYWDFDAKFRTDGRPITTHGRETQIYRRFPSGWRILHVHYSGMPAAQPGQGF